LSSLKSVVCIVGAGPAGLAVAHLLRRAHVACVVLERLRAEDLRARTKAGLIEQRTVELLRPSGLASPILERGARNGVCEFRADGQAFVLDYGALNGSPGHYIFPQHELVAEWAEQLLAGGGDVRFGMRATAVTQDEHGARVTARSEASGEELVVDCDLVAACDGAAGSLAADASAITAATWRTRSVG
jgi:p-hydroxybenzoate 3-monooxygenase